MAEELIALAYSLLSGVFAIFCFYLSLAYIKYKKEFYVFFLILTTASWSGLEWSFWLMGKNMFDIILYPAVPFDFFFLSWIVIAGWLGERLGQRKIFMIWLVVLALIFAIARICMNCIQF